MRVDRFYEDFVAYGFVPSLQRYVTHVNNQTEAKATLIVYGERKILNIDIEWGICKIFAKAIEHINAKAGQVTLQLIYHKALLHVSIEENSSIKELLDAFLAEQLAAMSARVLENSVPNLNIAFEIPY
jgi:hypothetical protein